MRRVGMMLGLMVLVAMLGIGLRAQQQSSTEKPASPPAMHAPQPGPEMVRLQKFYLGTWDYTETYPKGGFAPEGGVNSGVYKSELGPGGFSLINHFHSKGPVGDFEGLLIMTWDAQEKAYKSYIFGNDFPGAVVETGIFEGDTLVFRGDMTVRETKISMRNSTRIGDDGKLNTEEFMAMGGAPETAVVRVLATRRP
jgi:hypothetical protein